MASIFLTGYPGFLGTQLVERLLARTPSDTVINCLVQPAYRPIAECRAKDVAARLPETAGRIQFYDGDITQPDLGLGKQYQELVNDTYEIYHLAAVYDLGVERSLAMRVNLNGTRHMLKFAEHVPELRRFQYVSTCYVSGRYPGVFFEDDLVKGQRFNNYYEETKYLAEIEVQACREAGMPVTIYRPSVVLGDSQTGETQKYDGLYYYMQLLLRQPSSAALVPVVGEIDRFELNVVPSDYVINAIAYLSALDRSDGKVYQLCDPNPPSIRQVVDLMAEVTGQRLILVPLPGWLARASLKYLEPVQNLLRIEPAIIDYITMPTHYTCENTQADLEGVSFCCPSLRNYLPTLMEFMKAHPAISPKAMV